MPDKTEHRPVWNKSNTLLFILLIVSAGMIYFLPPILSHLLFLPFLFLAWRSKRDYIWVAFLFILLEHPSGFFSGSTRADPQRVPLYSLGHGFSFMFEEFLIFVLIFKSFYKDKVKIILNKIEGSLIIILTALLILIGLIWGAGFNEIVRTARMLIPYSLVFFLPRLLPSERDFVELAGLLFPFVFIILAGQIYEMINGAPIVALIKKGAIFSQYLQLDDNAVSAARIIDSSYLLFTILVSALFYFFSKKNFFPKNYLAIIIAISNLAIILTATRGWMISFFMMTGLMFMLNSTRFSVRSTMIVIISIFLVYNFALKNQKISKQISLSFERFATMQALVKGDVTANGTLARLNVRGPRVMRKFKESPFLGFGFSKDYFEHMDFHVGNQTMLLNMGVFGFTIWMGIYLLLIYKTFLRRQSLANNNPYKAAFWILPLSLVGILSIHSSSAYWLGFVEAKNQIISLAIILTMISIYYNISRFNQEHKA